MCLILYDICNNNIVTFLVGGGGAEIPSHLPYQINTVITCFSIILIAVVFLEMSHVAHCVYTQLRTSTSMMNLRFIPI